MTQEKRPSLLTVWITGAHQQWFVAGVDLEGCVSPLVRSEPGNLDQYVGQSDDEQVSFLRHRLSGAMQRGCDRLWARNEKALRIVLVFDGDLPECNVGVLPLLADHFHTWMTRPAISCYFRPSDTSGDGLDSFQCLVGDPELDQARALGHALPQLHAALDDGDGWEVIQKPKD